MCNDKAINYLSSIGFNTIQLPIEGIEPLFLLRTLDSGYLESLGPVIELITPCTQGLIPDIKNDCKVKNPKIEGLVTDSFSFDIGTEIINHILKQFGIKNDIFQEIGFSYKKVKKVKFLFEDILCDATTVEQLGRYLRVGQACEVSKFLPDIIIDKTNDNPGNRDRTNPIINPPTKHPPYFVVIKTLKSNSFSVEAYDDKDRKVDLSLQLSGGISVGAGCSISSKSENLVTFKGNKHLVFAVQTAPIFIEKRGAGSNLISKFEPPKNVNDFTGELFKPQESLGSDPFLMSILQ